MEHARSSSAATTLCVPQRNPACCPAVTRCAADNRTTEALAALAHSPQFQQQLSTFSQALQTGQLDLSQFGLRAAVSLHAVIIATGS